MRIERIRLESSRKTVVILHGNNGTMRLIVKPDDNRDWFTHNYRILDYTKPNLMATREAILI